MRLLRFRNICLVNAARRLDIAHVSIHIILRVEVVFRQTIKFTSVAALIVSFALAGYSTAWATDATADATVAPITLTPAEVAERESRKACKIQICSAFRVQSEGDDIACNITKSWRKSQLDKVMQKASVSWPWGPVECRTDLKLNRAEMIKSMTADQHDMVVDKHTVLCTVQSDEGPANIEFSFAPKVKFEKGIAKKASLNWGEIKAPTLVKSAMWAATATDNTFNILQSTLVEDINDFISKKCDEVKADWQQ